MKKIIFILLLAILTFPLVNAGTLIYGNSPQVKVYLMSQLPDPVEPGQVVTVKFKIENNGTETVSDSIAKLVPKFPFTLYGDVAEKNVGILRAASYGSNAVIVKYNLKVDEKAVEGDAELELQLKVDQAWYAYNNKEFNLNIQTEDAILDISSISIDPKMVAPGETTQVSIQVKNYAHSTLRDIKFKLNLTNDVPFVPYQSSSQRTIPLLQGGYQDLLTFDLQAKPDSTPGLHKVPLTITYQDNKGKSYTSTDILAIPIGATPKIKPYIKKSSILQAGKEGKLTLEIANEGTSNVKFLELTLVSSDDYKLISTSDYFYIGNVDADDTQSEEIELYINKDAQVLSFPVKLKYLDANNREFQQQFDLSLNLYSAGDLKKFGLLKSNYGWVYLPLIIVAIGGYLFYRKYRKKNHD